MMPVHPATHSTHHHGLSGLVSAAAAWLRGSATARHIQAANTALDRVDSTLDRLDEAGHLVATHLGDHHD